MLLLLAHPGDQNLKKNKIGAPHDTKDMYKIEKNSP